MRKFAILLSVAASLLMFAGCASKSKPEIPEAPVHDEYNDLSEM